jgi:hypothetical protein
MNTKLDIKESLLAALAKVRRGSRLMIEATTPGGHPRPAFPAGRLKMRGRAPHGFDRILCICPMGGTLHHLTGAPARNWILKSADGRVVYLNLLVPPPSRLSSKSRMGKPLGHEHEIIGVETELDVALFFETEWEVVRDVKMRKKTAKKRRMEESHEPQYPSSGQ